MTAERARQRLWAGIRRDIGRIETYLGGLTRSQFARDDLRRDAVERCMARIAAIADRLPAQDRARYPALAILGTPGLRPPLDRLDSDVVWGVARALSLRVDAAL
jgi:uncharacterized protein with HEPN domain